MVLNAGAPVYVCSLKNNDQYDLLRFGSFNLEDTILSGTNIKLGSVDLTTHIYFQNWHHLFFNIYFPAFLSVKCLSATLKRLLLP